jgi:hypothetical protein
LYITLMAIANKDWHKYKVNYISLGVFYLFFNRKQMGNMYR